MKKPVGKKLFSLVAIPILQKMADDLGGSNNFIFAALKELTGKVPGPEIWYPIR